MGRDRSCGKAVCLSTILQTHWALFPARKKKETALSKVAVVHIPDVFSERA